MSYIIVKNIKKNERKTLEEKEVRKNLEASKWPPQASSQSNWVPAGEFRWRTECIRGVSRTAWVLERVPHAEDITRPGIGPVEALNLARTVPLQGTGAGSWRAGSCGQGSGRAVEARPLHCPALRGEVGRPPFAVDHFILYMIASKQISL
jgi:hypothetical protein